MTMQESPWGWLLNELDKIMLDSNRSEHDVRKADWLWQEIARGSGEAAAVSVGSGFVAHTPHHSGHNLWLHDTIQDWDGA